MIPAKMSRQDIERHFERALPFLVGCLSVLVALLLPLVISTYIQISSKGNLGAILFLFLSPSINIIIKTLLIFAYLVPF